MSWVLVVGGFAALIILHEFGHFAMAKATGMRVERFFLFFPPKLVRFRRGETEYGIGLIPLGGFVKITGMNPEELEAAERGEEIEARPGLLEQIEGADSSAETPPSLAEAGAVDPEILKRAYYNQPVWKRIVVIAAGPVMNILIAFVLLFAVYLSLPIPKGIAVDQVQPGSPAAKALQPGDRLLSVNDIPATVPNPSTFNDVNDRLSASDRKFGHITKSIRQHKCPGGKAPDCLSPTPNTVTVRRGNQTLTFRIPTYFDPTTKLYRLGVRFKAVGSQTASQSPAEAAKITLDKMWFVTSRTLSVIGRIFEPAQRKQLSGIVGGSKALNQAIGFDVHQALFVLAVISLSLGLINLFPFLPLDGGHIFWSLVEKVRGRRVPFSVIERASAIGFLLVIFLFVIGLTNDINRLSS